MERRREAPRKGHGWPLRVVIWSERLSIMQNNYCEKSGQRLESDLCWKLQEEEKKKKRWELEAMELDVLKETKQVKLKK